MSNLKPSLVNVIGSIGTKQRSHNVTFCASSGTVNLTMNDRCLSWASEALAGTYGEGCSEIPEASIEESGNSKTYVFKNLESAVDYLITGSLTEAVEC